MEIEIKHTKQAETSLTFLLLEISWYLPPYPSLFRTYFYACYWAIFTVYLTIKRDCFFTYTEILLSFCMALLYIICKFVKIYTSFENELFLTAGRHQTLPFDYVVMGDNSHYLCNYRKWIINRRTNCQIHSQLLFSTWLVTSDNNELHCNFKIFYGEG